MKGLLAVVLLAPTIPLRSQSPEVTLPDKAVRIEEGTFQFTGMRLAPVTVAGAPYVINLGTYMKGSVSNGTTKSWTALGFSLRFFNANGEALGDEVLMLDSITLLPGAATAFKTSTLNPPAGTKKSEFVFRGGSYRAFYEFSLEKPAPSKDLKYSNEFADFELVPDKHGIGLHLRNRSDRALKIDWNQVSFVDGGGQSGGVMHNGVKYADREGMKAPSVIPPSALLEDVIVPTGLVSFGSGTWLTAPLFPDAPLAARYEGATVGLYLPLEVDGKVVPVFFSIRVDHVTY
jgi:hypothetical protein